MRLSPKIIFATFALTLLGLSQPKIPGLESTDETIKVLCWIPTEREFHENRSIHVKNTWGKRCDQLVFFSTSYDEMLPSVVVKSPPGDLWGKVRNSIKILYETYLYQADWFLKADDDTYVIIENLKYLLKDYDSSQPIIFGCKFKDKPKEYMFGGAGYVLSRAAIQRLVEVAFEDPKNCSTSSRKHEGYEFGVCLHKAGVTLGDSLDEFARHRFFPLNIEYHTQPFMDKNTSWILKKNPAFNFPGIPNCSKRPISFHNITPGFMYAFEYLLYNVKVMKRNLTKNY